MKKLHMKIPTAKTSNREDNSVDPILPSGRIATLPFRIQITDIAEKTDLDRFGYAQFSQIISDMIQNGSSCEELIVLFLYLKDLWYIAWMSGRYHKCLDIFKYIITYLKGHVSYILNHVLCLECNRYIH